LKIMGHRLSKIYTRTGDQGTTGLGDGSRLAKDDVRIEAIGTIDELNSCLGVLLTHALPSTLHSLLIRIQHELFDLGGELSIPSLCLIKAAAAERLEQEIDQLNAELPPLKEFILPGGNPAAAACHVARAVCRRAERCLVRLSRGAAINNEALIYVNRLSDLLFVIARVLVRKAGEDELQWQSSQS
jgi:cob(I)alamin adenosyltransferase